MAIRSNGFFFSKNNILIDPSQEPSEPNGDQKIENAVKKETKNLKEELILSN